MIVLNSVCARAACTLRVHPTKSSPGVKATFPLCYVGAPPSWAWNNITCASTSNIF